LPSKSALDHARARERHFGRSWEELRQWPELELEIGCGVGWHSLKRAISLSQARERKRGLIAIERTREKFEAFARRWTRHTPEQTAHLTAIQADARLWCAREIHSPILDQVWILYPNPEQGRPQRNWLREPFFSHLSQVVKPKGRLTLATNSETYFRDAQEALQLWKHVWKIDSQKSWSQATHVDFSPRTHFEKKYFERGEHLFELELERCAE
jgi:tRNA G46 methylase TrmB